MTPTTSPLLTDLYELNMVQAYLDKGEDGEAVFEFFVRRLPSRRGFLLAAGLEDALEFLETMRYSADEIDWLKSTGRFRDNLLDYLRDFRFTGVSAGWKTPTSTGSKRFSFHINRSGVFGSMLPSTTRT